MRDAAPLALVCDQLDERSRVASIERVRRRSQLVDHTLNDATGSPRRSSASGFVAYEISHTGWSSAPASTE
jgi:hypothetical protein